MVTKIIMARGYENLANVNFHKGIPSSMIRLDTRAR